MTQGDGKRGKRLVIALLTVAVLCALAAIFFNQHHRPQPTGDPSPLQSFW